MKTTIYSIMAAILLSIAAVIPASAQSLPVESKREMISQMRKMLPMEIGDGLKWTQLFLNEDGTMMTCIMKYTAPKGGMSCAKLREEMAKFSDAEWKENIGKEFAEMQKMMDLDVKLTFEFPDATPTFTHIFKKEGAVTTK